MSIEFDVSGLEELAKQLENMADTCQNDTEEYLSQFHKGKIVEINCPVCKKQTESEIIDGGKVKCNKCGFEGKFIGKIL
jgi:ribosomal protein L37AE/L43A